MADAIIIGGGPNGLVAAIQLADAGWEVLVLEAQEAPGGAVKSAQVTRPGFVHDLFSAFYPLGIASPVIAGLGLEDHGLTWRRSEVVVAHPDESGTSAAIALDIDETVESLEQFHTGDGEAWRELYATWERLGDALLESLFSPFPPLRGTGKLLARLGGPREIQRFLRFAMLSVRRLGEETFRGAGGMRLLAGNALHADLSPDAAAGGLYGWLLCSLGQQLGWPVPEGGAGKLTAALVRRLEAAGGEVRTSQAVERVVIRGGRARGVMLAGGEEVGARQAILATTTAPALYGDLLAGEEIPAELTRDLKRFHWDNGTVKINWALSAPIPWPDELSRRAGTVHVTEGVDALADHSNHLAAARIPDRPFLVVGQYASFDATRAPDGGEAAWAYTHVPQRVVGDSGGQGLTGAWDARESGLFADRMELEVERLAPGFRDLILDRDVMSPPKLEAMNANLVGGALNAGTAQLHQQVVFRPTVNGASPATPFERLFLAGASAHPGGGVHGAAGANAALAALHAADGTRQALLWPARSARDAAVAFRDLVRR